MRGRHAAFRGALNPQALTRIVDPATAVARWETRLRTENPLLFVAWLDEEAAGFAGGGAERGEPREGFGEMYAIYVLPRLWRRGVATALQRSLLEALQIREFSSAVVWTHQHNSAAISFYETTGWRNDVTSRLVEVGGQELTALRFSRSLSARVRETEAHIPSK